MIEDVAQAQGKRAFRLHITIIMIFVILTLPVMLIFVIITYRANEQLMIDHTERFVQKVKDDHQANAQRLFGPVVNAARTAATLMRDTPDYFIGESSADYLQEILSSNEGVYGAYASFEDGTFRQVRSAAGVKAILGQELPPDTQFISRFLDGNSKTNTESGTTYEDTYSFQAPWGVKIGEVSGPSNYNARQQAFYQNAVNSKGIYVTDPYTFSSSGELGLTIASPAANSIQPIGVIAVDMTLKSISQFLAENKSTANSLAILADESGNVIAHPQFESGIIKKDGQSTLARLEKLADPRVLVAMGERLRTRQDVFKFKAGPDGTEYLAVFAPFSKEFKKPWEVLTITPTDDFVGDIRRNKVEILLFSAFAFVVQILLIYVMSRTIARPIEQLANEVTYIREFKFDQIQRINSRVREISHLSDAIAMLERALGSFTSYVPTALVQQLMNSGQATKLGVESRYLTIFFTDLEGFSTLSESEPSQQLLRRVSAYFSTVTRAVEQAQGTVDKFIGDAVMAFWGAPVMLNNHAYLACVAAVRAQHGMRSLNEAWTAEKMPPLKLRIGIHSDAVLVGNVGSVERVSYTVMGDGVNVAARLESLNKEMGTWTCVSHNVFREAGEHLWMRPIDTVVVKGRRGELLVYELLAIKSDDPELMATPEEIELCEMTFIAYGHYAQQNYEQALIAYNRILVKFPEDPVALRMREKSRINCLTCGLEASIA